MDYRLKKYKNNVSLMRASKQDQYNVKPMGRAECTAGAHSRSDEVYPPALCLRRRSAQTQRTSAVRSCTLPGSGTPQKRMAAHSHKSRHGASAQRFAGWPRARALLGDWLCTPFIAGVFGGFAPAAFITVIKSMARHTAGCDKAWHGLCNCCWGHLPEF